MMDGSNSKFVNLINAGEYNGYTIRDNLPTDLVDYSSVVFDSFDGSIVDTPDDTEAPYSIAAQAAFYAAIVQGKQYGMVYDFELPTAGNFVGTEGASYSPESSQSVFEQTGSILNGTGHGSLQYDSFLSVNIFENGHGGSQGDSPGDDLGIATNIGNDADRGYNQTFNGSQYLEVLPSENAEGGVGFMFEEAASGFGFFLMGRESISAMSISKLFFEILLGMWKLCANSRGPIL